MIPRSLLGFRDGVATGGLRDLSGDGAVASVAVGVSADAADWTVTTMPDDAGFGTLDGWADELLVVGGVAEPGTGASTGTVVHSVDGGTWEAAESGRFRNAGFVALAVSDDLALLAGYRQTRGGARPYALWTTDSNASAPCATHGASETSAVLSPPPLSPPTVPEQ